MSKLSLFLFLFGVGDCLLAAINFDIGNKLLGVGALFVAAFCFWGAVCSKGE